MVDSYVISLDRKVEQANVLLNAILEELKKLNENLEKGEKEDE